MQFQGPLPPPATLKMYKEVDPSFAERIMKMAEANNEANIQTEKKFFEDNAKTDSRGQWLSFVLGMSCLIVGVVLAVLNLNVAAITAIVSGLTPVLISTINNVIQSNKK